MLERFFGLRAAGTTVRRELIGGVTTFLTMAYIIVVNPAVLGETGMDFGAVMTATCLAAGIASAVMGLVANYPIAMAPAMGENFFFIAVATTMGFGWRVALGAVLLSGVTFLALTALGVRERIIDALPASLRHAIAVGIGLFVALLGLTAAGIVERPAAGGMLHLGDLTRMPTLVACAGVLTTVVLLARGVRGALLGGIALATALAWSLGLVGWQGALARPPSIAPTLLQLDVVGALRPHALPAVLVFLFMAVFDAVGTLVAIGEQGGFFRDGRLPRARRALLADSAGTVLGACLGTATVTAYVESAAGVAAGARTGLANLVTAAGFFAALFCAPLVRMIGGGVPVAGGAVLQPLTAPALVVAGIPLAWSIADGMAFGFIARPLLKLLAGRAHEASAVAYVLAALFVLRYALL